MGENKPELLSLDRHGLNEVDHTIFEDENISLSNLWNSIFMLFNPPLTHANVITTILY